MPALICFLERDMRSSCVRGSGRPGAVVHDHEDGRPGTFDTSDPVGTDLRRARATWPGSPAREVHLDATVAAGAVLRVRAADVHLVPLDAQAVEPQRAGAGELGRREGVRL